MFYRSDNRAPDQLRPVNIIPDYVSTAEGSVLIEVGNTRVCIRVALFILNGQVAVCKDWFITWSMALSPGKNTLDHSCIPFCPHTRRDMLLCEVRCYISDRPSLISEIKHVSLYFRFRPRLAVPVQQHRFTYH